MFNRVGMNFKSVHMHRKSELPILRPRASINMADMGAACLSSTTPNTKHLHMYTGGTASSLCLLLLPRILVTAGSSIVLGNPHPQ